MTDDELWRRWNEKRIVIPHPRECICPDRLWEYWNEVHGPVREAKPRCLYCGHSYYRHSSGCYSKKEFCLDPTCTCEHYSPDVDDHDWSPFRVLATLYLAAWIPVHAYKLVRWTASQAIKSLKPKSGAKRAR